PGDAGLGGGRRGLGGREPARRLGERRAVAPRRHTRAQAARVRRLRGGGGVADRRRLDHARAAGQLRRIERRPARRRRLTQHPEKYAAVVCSAPLLDMVRYELFGLGSTWSGEYGTAADPEHLAWLLAYSPYHRVRPGVSYPATMFTVFEGDTRVDPLHARKLAAALQYATS